MAIRPFWPQSWWLNLTKLDLNLILSWNHINWNFTYVTHQFQMGVIIFFTACMECERCLAMRIPPVCPSVERVHSAENELRSVHIFIPYETKFRVVLYEEQRTVLLTPSLCKFGWSPPPTLERNRKFSPDSRS